MKVLTEGHLYELENFEDKTQQGQRLQFIQKEPIGDDKGTLRTVSDGTTNEEILAMLIDRMKVLGSKFPCRENSIAITKMEEALMWMEKRTRDRLARGVEGKHLP